MNISYMCLKIYTRSYLKCTLKYKCHVFHGFVSFFKRHAHTHIIAFPPRDLSSAISDLNEDLNEISRWCCANSLLINSEKTKVQVIGVSQLIRNLPPIPPIKILGKVINPVPVVKDLGVSIDCYLNYNENTKELVSNCMFKLSRINRIKHLLDRKTILLLMEVFVFSKLFYCSTIDR